MIRVHFPKGNTPEECVVEDEAWNWLLDNLAPARYRYECLYNENVIIFQDRSDAMMFKLSIEGAR